MTCAAPKDPVQRVEIVKVFRKLGTAAILSLALAMPAQEAAAQDVGDLLFGGAVGALLGGAVGGGHGAAIGGLIGATAGGIIGAEGERRRHGYYYYRDGCYIHHRDGTWVRVHPRHCY
jgi:uncharacterized protein YcfJ